MIQLKRAYEPAGKEDGFRVLVDRLWPRGMSKEKEHLDLWLKEVAPSKELRQWFNHEQNKFPEFVEKYQVELQNGDAKTAIQTLLRIVQSYPVVTFIYGAKDQTYNNAVALKDIIENRLD
ncbi:MULTISPECIES: DUF488 domain-containing protein [unclassified Enterococcus]|uniref:DUF488 domain-containing protein n=1 Tax=unclassified Enterococcus TaxID=2608891 RepID=UPI001CE2154A|nr:MULTISPECIES: DUF488 family protein [unclassified Enterococcus]MCA5011451.1 DUF488 family protein [Enterococcus sp. S23]MCA5015107.1 DUF488 family protein [Enterococcus sp. S22(2020)]